MMRLFGGFGARALRALCRVRSAVAGLGGAVPLHQIAPLVVHAIKFGGGYVAAAGSRHRPLRVTTATGHRQTAASINEIANPTATSDPVNTPSTSNASGSSVSATIARSAPAAKASASAPLWSPPGSSSR